MGQTFVKTDINSQTLTLYDSLKYQRVKRSVIIGTKVLGSNNGIVKKKKKKSTDRSFVTVACFRCQLLISLPELIRLCNIEFNLEEFV